jgi:hypothetical protein
MRSKKRKRNYCSQCMVKMRWHNMYCPFCGRRIWSLGYISLLVVSFVFLMFLTLGLIFTI